MKRKNFSMERSNLNEVKSKTMGLLIWKQIGLWRVIKTVKCSKVQILAQKNVITQLHTNAQQIELKGSLCKI